VCVYICVFVSVCVRGSIEAYLFVAPVRNFENVILVACEKKLFRHFCAIFVVADLPQKEVLYYLTIYSLLLNSVEPRAITCLLKQSNPSAWSLLS